jgi:hypothetical protein
VNRAWRRLRHARARPLVDGRGFPARRHPESLTRELPGRDEEYLAELAAGLWPQDEYSQIIDGGQRPSPTGRGEEHE